MNYWELLNNRSRVIWVCLLFLLGLAFIEANAAEEYRSYTGSNGKAIRAKILDLKPNMVEMRLDNGQYFNVPYSKFSKEDQKYLRNLFKKKNEVVYDKNSNVEITFYNGVNTQHEDYWDDRITVKPRISFNNKEYKKSYDGVNGTMIILGKSTLRKNDSLKIFLKENFTVDLPAANKTVHKFKKAYSGTYANGRRYNYHYGYKYHTYILVVRNISGDIIYSHIPKTITVENALRVKKGKTYDRKLEVSCKSATMARALSGIPSFLTRGNTATVMGAIWGWKCNTVRLSRRHHETVAPL